MVALLATVGIASVLLAPAPACNRPQTVAALRDGVLYFYAYNARAAVVAFRGAASFSPRCAAAYAGRAIAEGGNLNFPMTAASMKEGAKAAATAASLQGNATLEQRQLIAALVRRYAGTFPDRAAADRDYVAALRSMADRGIAREDAELLLCEALLERDGARLWSSAELAAEHAEVETRLRDVQALRPGDLMADHLYVHLHDLDPDRAAALPAADRLASADLDPEAEHLIHMSAHAYVRAGRYADALSASTQALRLSIGVVGGSEYLAHDFAVGEGAAFNGADAGAADRFIDEFCTDECTNARIAGAARFARWDQVLRLTAGREDAFALLFSSRALLGQGETARGLALFERLRLESPSLASHANLTTVAAAAARNDRQTLLRLAHELDASNDAGAGPEFLATFPDLELKAHAYAAAGALDEARAALRADLAAYPCNVRATVALAALTVENARPAHPAYCTPDLQYTDGRTPSIDDF
ncbi:MAG TPA: hypothetical protein VGN14_05410 [Candidatus Elarobacter sp.]